MRKTGGKKRKKKQSGKAETWSRWGRDITIGPGTRGAKKKVTRQEMNQKKAPPNRQKS